MMQEYPPQREPLTVNTDPHGGFHAHATATTPYGRTQQQDGDLNVQKRTTMPSLDQRSTLTLKQNFKYNNDIRLLIRPG